MLKKIGILVFSILLVASMKLPVYADAIFDIDLSDIGGNNYGVYNDIRLIAAAGTGFVDQSFGGNAQLDVGDPFTEMAFLQEVSYFKENSNVTNFFSGLTNAGLAMYVYATGLEGIVSSIASANPANPIFEYEFDPTKGSLGMFIGNLGLDIDTFNPLSAIPLASFDFIGGDGDARDGFFFGTLDTGSTNLSAYLDPVNSRSDVFFVDGFGDLTLLPAERVIFGISTRNTISEGPEFYTPGSSKDFPNSFGFNATVTSAGLIDVNVVPEPSTALLLGIGLLGLGSLARRKN